MGSPLVVNAGEGKLLRAAPLENRSAPLIEMTPNFFDAPGLEP
jgi:hypothetical protein